MRTPHRVAAVLLVTFLVGGCGDGDSTTASFCRVLEEEWLPTIEGEPTVDEILQNADDFDAMSQALEESESRLADMKADLLGSAPADLRNDLELMFDSDPDSIDLDEQEAYADASARVNGIVADDCRLDVTL